MAGVFDDLKPSLVRGVIRIGADCEHCDAPVAILGMPGKGRPLESFPRGYFCRGHAIRV